MKIDAIIEQEQIRTIVIYPGRFQPPHIGHAKTYQMLAKKYGAGNTYVATSNKTEGDKSPFDFAEKQQLLAAAGVPADKIVQVVNTYAAKEITDQFDLSKTRVFYAVGAKDMAEDPRFKNFVKKDGTPAYLQKLEGAKNIETADKHAYLIVAPTVEFTVNGKPFTSASEFRQAFKNANPAEQAELAQQLYGAGAQKVLPILQNKLFKTEEDAIRESVEQMWLEAKRKRKSKRRSRKAAFGGYWPYYFGSTVDSGEGGGGGGGESANEAWSEKYKRSINCNNPKGFSQRAHCAGRKKANENQLLDKPTPTVKELADKYRKTIPEMNHILGKGIKVEMEHTNDVEIAREIALDHLAERVDYYELLDKVERAPKKLDELANDPYPYMLWKRTMMGNSYLFQTDGGQEIVVSIVPETLSDGTNRVEVMFADKKDFGLEKTGKGDAFRIFATVAQILKDYIAQAKFEVGEIYFTGKTNEPSRIKLYDKIARRLGHYLQGFEFTGSGDNSVEKGYFFKKTGEKVEEEVIDEVSMSPGALADFAKTDIAKNMTVGFEAEMAIEGMVDDEPNYDDSEPDWDANESVPMNSNWRNSIIRFFTSPDAAMNNRTEVEGVLQEIDEEYFEWLGDQYQEWLDSDDSAETITKFLKDYDEDISDEDIEDTIKFKKNNYWGSIEDDVREDWEADNMNDDSFREFMEYRDYDTMQGIYDRHTDVLYWPYFTEPDYGGGSVSYEEIEMSFVETTGYKATVSSGYHSATRRPGVWIFEPDSSIEPSGVELVSPPMPLDEGLKALDDFFAWAKSYGAEANESTGFHMGVSIPEQTMDNVDHLKLILFLGDEYVLKQFGRESNTYTKSSLDRMRGQLRSPRANIPELLAQFKQGLNSEAAKMAGSLMVPKGDRYVSVNIKSNYIEFRSAGGNYFEKIPEIKNTMLRYVRAMAIAADPEAEKNEYAKKLYKLISTAFPEDLTTIQYFSKYAAGTITRSELKNIVTYARSERQRKAAPAAPPKTYEIYLIGTDYVFHTFTARDDEEANDYATAWARQNNKTDWDVRLSKPRPLPGSTPGVVPGSTADRAQQRAAAADPTLTTYSAKYRDQNGVEGSIGITASNYAQAQEQYMNLRRAYPHISFIGLQTNTSPQEAEEQRRRAAAAAGSTVGGRVNEEEIDRVPGGWKHYKKAFGRPSTVEPLPLWSKFQGRYRNKKGSWEDIVHYMTFLQKDYRTAGIDDLTGDEIANHICSDANADPKKSLADFNADRDKKGLDNFDSWTDLYDAIRDFEKSRMYGQLAANAKRKAGDQSLDEMLKQVKGKWALVSRQDPKKVLQYYRGHGKPSEDWVNKVERRVQAFKHMEEATTPKPFVFVDMDGVLADFFGEWAKLDHKDHYKDIEHKEKALDLVRHHPTFWTKLPLLPHAKDLLHFIKENYGDYYILSKPLEGDPRSEPGKRAWIREHLQDVMPAKMIFTADKQRFAYVGGQPNILIDDFGKNIDLWKMNGGIGIKYRPRRFQETIKILRGLSR